MYGPVIGIVKEVAPGGLTLCGYDIPDQTQMIVRQICDDSSNVATLFWLSIMEYYILCTLHTCTLQFTMTHSCAIIIVHGCATL